MSGGFILQSNKTVRPIIPIPRVECWEFIVKRGFEKSTLHIHRCRGPELHPDNTTHTLDWNIGFPISKCKRGGLVLPGAGRERVHEPTGTGFRTNHHHHHHWRPFQLPDILIFSINISTVSVRLGLNRNRPAGSPISDDHLPPQAFIFRFFVVVDAYMPVCLCEYFNVVWCVHGRLVFALCSNSTHFKHASLQMNLE